MADRHSEVVDCGAGQARLQLASKEQLADPTRWWLVDPVVQHLQINQEEQRRGKTDCAIPGLQCREIKPQTTD